MNVVAFVGEIAELPVVKETVNGNKYADMVLKVSRPFMNNEGVYEQDELSCTLWRGIAETTASVARLGDYVAIKGRLQSRSFEGNDGNMHRSIDIIAEHVSFIGQRKA